MIWNSKSFRWFLIIIIIFDVIANQTFWYFWYDGFIVGFQAKFRHQKSVYFLVSFWCKKLIPEPTYMYPKKISLNQFHDIKTQSKLFDLLQYPRRYELHWHSSSLNFSKSKLGVVSGDLWTSSEDSLHGHSFDLIITGN